MTGAARCAMLAALNSIGGYMHIAAASFGLVLFCASLGTAHAQASGDDAGLAAAIAKCGEDVSKEVFLKLPKAERERKLSCYMKAGADDVARKLPMKADALTTVTAVELTHLTLTYRNTVDVLLKDVPAGALDVLKTSVRASVCAAPPMQQTTELGGSYRYIWLDRTGAKIGELLVADCKGVGAAQ